MMNRRGAEGKPGMLLATLIFIAMAAATWIYYAPSAPGGSLGLCLPAPWLWPLEPLTSEIAACALIFFTALLAGVFNRTFSIVPGTSIAYAAIFLVACGAQPVVTARLTAAPMLALAALIGVWLLCNSVGKRAPTECFLLAAMLSAGSMIQYAFALLLPVFLLCAIVGKVMKFKEFIAFLLGIIAPYWIAIGFGLVSLDSFRLPELYYITASGFDKVDFLLTVILTGITGLLYVICTLLQAVQLYSANARNRAFYGIFNVLGFGTLALMMIDFGNFTAYIAILNLMMAFSAAELLQRSLAKSTWPPMLLGMAAYVAFFIFFIRF